VASRFPYREAIAITHESALRKLSAEHSELTNLTFIDERALAAWEDQWLPAMPPDKPWSDWDWREEMRRWSGYRRRFDMAIWAADQLCGLTLGTSSHRKQNFSLRALQASPVENRRLKGHIAAIAIDVGHMYGTALGCKELRLLRPLPGILPLYLGPEFRFQLAKTSLGVRYCVRAL
jgi:hypothetical protein